VNCCGKSPPWLWACRSRWCSTTPGISALVQNLARELDIELLFLPSFSPNLNLIERLWKFTKKKARHCRGHTN